MLQTKTLHLGIELLKYDLFLTKIDRGREMFEWTTGGTHCIPHWSWTVKAGEHEGYTLWFVAGGKGSLYLGEECYALSAGDIFFSIIEPG